MMRIILRLPNPICYLSDSKLHIHNSKELCVPQVDLDSVRLAFLVSGSATWTGKDSAHEKTVPYSIIAQPTIGAYEISYAGRSERIDTGDAFFAPANTPLHITHQMKAGLFAARWVHLTFSIFDGLDLFSLYVSPMRLTDAKAKRAGELIERLLSPSPDDMLARLTDTASCIASAWPIAELVCSVSSPRRDADEVLRRTERLAPLLAYVRQNLGSPLTVPDLADRAFMSPSGFYAYFKQHLGSTPLAYVKRMRLDEAAYQLTRTDLSLDQIATNVGFANPFHLSREFKRQFGESPSIYRKKSRKF
jgi:AraC-like DNA-binding protein